jgi:2-aminoadipate transaminase
VQIEMDDDGMRVDGSRRRSTPDGEGRRPKFIYTIPSFQNPGGVTMSLERRRRWSRSRASARCSCSRTTRTACCATRASPLPTLRSLDGGDYVIYLGRSRRSSRRAAARLGGAPRPVLEKLNLGKQGADLCSSTLRSTSSRRTSRAGLARVRATLTELYRRRRDTMLEALAEHLPAEATWTRPEGGCSSGRRCRLHRHTDLLRAGAARERRVRARGGRPTSTAAAARRCG